MDKNREASVTLTIERTRKRLEENNFTTYYAASKKEALECVKRIVKEGSITSSGGSMTLSECGIIDFLKAHTEYIDRNIPLEAEEKKRRERATFSADFYFLSANAITEHGEVYEVDGNGNRVAALAFGPEQVVIVAGFNKIVPNLRAATERVKHVASPANCIRLSIDSACARSGACVQEAFDENHLMCKANCKESSICADTLILSRQRKKGRISIILVGESLGY